MKPPVNRRTLLIAAGSAVVAVFARTVSAQSHVVRGAIKYTSGKVIPKGHINIRIEDPSMQDGARQGKMETKVNSDGKSETVLFSLVLPARLNTSHKMKVVAHLERDDGWLLARGSSPLAVGAPVSITLYTAMY